MGKAHEAREALKSFLEKHGFSVEHRGSLRGASGIVHVFDLVAVKGDTVLCFDFACADEDSVLRAAVKAMDVRGARVFLLLDQACPSNAPVSLEGKVRVSIVFFEGTEDLLEKVGSAIAQLSLSDAQLESLETADR